MEKSLVNIAWDDLMSNRCVCGVGKKKQQSFCRACYFALPASLRSRLYTAMSDGYAEIYDEAKDWLRINTDRLKASAT